MKEKDFFNRLIKEGIKIESGLIGENLKPYRVYEYQGKYFKLTLEELNLKEEVKKKCLKN